MIFWVGCRAAEDGGWSFPLAFCSFREDVVVCGFAGGYFRGR